MDISASYPSELLRTWLMSAEPGSTYNERLPVYILLLSTIFCIYYVVDRCYVSPLARIPNAHPFSPLTQLWMDWRRYSGREIQTTSEAFQMKGPVVRLGPNEVAVNSIAYGVGTAHGHGLDNLDKTPWYNFFVNHG